MSFKWLFRGTGVELEKEWKEKSGCGPVLSAETNLGQVGPKLRFVPLFWKALGSVPEDSSLTVSVQWLPSESGFFWPSCVCSLLFLGSFLVKDVTQHIAFWNLCSTVSTQPGHPAKRKTTADSARPGLSLTLPTQAV